jgi:hypothetical protein
LTRRPRRAVGRIDAEPARDLLNVAVLVDGGLELLQALSNALLGVAKLIENGHGTLLTRGREGPCISVPLTQRALTEAWYVILHHAVGRGVSASARD